MFYSLLSDLRGGVRNMGQGERNWIADVLKDVAASALWAAVSPAVPPLAALGSAAGAWAIVYFSGAMEQARSFYDAYPPVFVGLLVLVFACGLFAGCAWMQWWRRRKRDEEQILKNAKRQFLGQQAEVRRIASRAYREGCVLVPDDQWHRVACYRSPLVNSFFTPSPQNVGVKVYLVEEARGFLDMYPDLLEPAPDPMPEGMVPIGIPEV